MKPITREERKAWDSMGFMRRMYETVKIMTAVNTTADNILAGYVSREEESQGRQPTCASCKEAYCCSQVVYVSAIEGLWITKGLRLSRFDGPEGVKDLDKLGRWQSSMLVKDWIRQHEPCPFLTEERRCLVYRYRPFACRWHYVWHDVDRCSPASVLVHGPSMGLPVTEAILSIVPAYYRLQELWGWGSAVGPLPVVVATVLKALRHHDQDHDDKIAEEIAKAYLRPPTIHGMPVAGFWPGVDIKAAKRAARRKR